MRLFKWLRPRYTVDYTLSIEHQLLSFDEEGLTQAQATRLMQSLGAYRHIHWIELRRE